MVLAFVGSRDWFNRDKIYEVMSKKKELAAKLGEDLTIVSGGAQGADSLSESVAKELGINVIVYNAQWKQYGKAAGPIRNQRILDDGRPDMVVAFRKKGASKVTDNMLEKTRKRKIPIEIYSD